MLRNLNQSRNTLVVMYNVNDCMDDQGFTYRKKELLGHFFKCEITWVKCVR